MPLPAASLAVSLVPFASQPAVAQSIKPTIVLVHGAFADASSWNAVIVKLEQDGYTVCAPPNMLRGLRSDAAIISRYIAKIPGPVVLVGHSYGGSVISVASARAKNVKALVYVDAFLPDTGDSALSLLTSVAGPPPPKDLYIQIPFTTATGHDTDMYLNPKYYGDVFASAEPSNVSKLMATTQRPITASALNDKAPAAEGWKTIPSWVVIGDADKVIPPKLMLSMATRAKSTISHAPGGDHPSMLAHPEVTVAAITAAAVATMK